MSTLATSITLEEFLQLPETKPASEYIDGKISQKPMPQGEHSLLQVELCQAINRTAKPQKTALPFPNCAASLAVLLLFLILPYFAGNVFPVKHQAESPTALKLILTWQ